MLSRIYDTLEQAIAASNTMTHETGRYWTAIRSRADGWIITDRYHPRAVQERPCKP